MNTLEHLLGGFGVALAPLNLLVAALGAFLGTVVGMLPGLGPINGVAILMPLAHHGCTMHYTCCSGRRPCMRR